MIQEAHAALCPARLEAAGRITPDSASRRTSSPLRVVSRHGHGPRNSGASCSVRRRTATGGRRVDSSGPPTRTSRRSAGRSGGDRTGPASDGLPFGGALLSREGGITLLGARSWIARRSGLPAWSRTAGGGAPRCGRAFTTGRRTLPLRAGGAVAATTGGGSRSQLEGSRRLSEHGVPLPGDRDDGVHIGRCARNGDRDGKMGTGRRS